MARVDVDLRKAGAAARVGAAADAVRALGEGGVVIAPGDTGGVLVIGAAGSAAGGQIAKAAGECAVWLAPDVDSVLRAAVLSRVGRKLIKQFAPGPLIWKIGMDEAGIAGVREGLKVGPGIVDDGRALHVRICGASIAATIASRAGMTLCAWEPEDDRAAASATASAGIEPAMVLREDAVGARKRPTIIALDRSGAIRVEREGAFERRYVEKHAALSILLVCTGNTCRSPMAEAIAAGMAARARPGDGASVKLNFSSAGIGAVSGAARTPEGNEAVKSLGFAPAKGGSHPITRQMIAEADLIYAMTRSHMAGVLALDPAAADKVFLLDPKGGDVADPIGMAQKAYNDTARNMERMIEQRLKEWRT